MVERLAVNEDVAGSSPAGGAKQKRYPSWVPFLLRCMGYTQRMNADIAAYHQSQSPEEREICNLLYAEIAAHLPAAQSKVWHAHPVWFLNGNPIVGYSKLKAGVRLMFWSGADFGDPGLVPGTGKFKDASVTFQTAGQVNVEDLARWLAEAKTIQWDYKNLVKRRGVLERIENL